MPSGLALSDSETKIHTATTQNQPAKRWCRSKKLLHGALVSKYILELRKDVLVVVGADPWGRSKHSYYCHNHTDDAPREYDLRSMPCDVMLEGSDNSEDEPGNTGCGTSRVNTANVLQKARPEYAHP